MWITRILLLGVLIFTAQTEAAGDGIPIKPDDDGKFEYVEDFKTPRFLIDGFVDNLGAAQWSVGSISNTGPNRNRMLTCRFHGDRTITGVLIEVDQEANGRNLGGRNLVRLSRNGLDWRELASSSSLEGDRNGQQRGVLTVSTDQAGEYLGGTELWLRVIMDNFSGLPTNTSNVIKQIKVSVQTGDVADAAGDPQADARIAWSTLRAAAGWQSIVLDRADAPALRAPHYYEDADGWLWAPGDSGWMAIEEDKTFTVRRAEIDSKRSPLSMAMFVQTNESDGPLMIRLTVLAARDGSRRAAVLWDGRELMAFDVANYFELERVFYITVPAPQVAGVHELRISGQDSRPVRIRRVELAGAESGGGSPQWVKKPALPGGGKLELLSTYYMPDPAPPAASQAVEGRHKKQEAGLIFAGMQRLYKEHADFGGVRLVMRNSGAVPVRIGAVKLNGEPIEDSYVDFKTSDWDARGVVWYRAKPRLVEPGKCTQLYIRFRRRPEGERADIEVAIENGGAVKVQVPYVDPGLSIDYVTTDESMDRLYVYARRSAGANPGRLLGVTLDGKPLKAAKVYGAEFPGGVALAVVQLPEAMVSGAYHVVGVETDIGRRVDAQFRALPFMYPRTSIHIPVDMCQQMHMNVKMWYAESLQACLDNDVYSATAGDPFQQHERVAFVMGPDEPDAHDNRGGGYHTGLGYHARRLAHSGWQELIDRHAPQAASWIIMNGTTRPLNWYVYGQVANISCFDPYPINFYAADHAYVRESLKVAQLAGAPNRMFGCMEAFGWSKGQGVPQGARGPTPAEYRQNIVQAIGCGMKGLTSWTYAAGAGGWQINEPCKEEIAKLNKLIEHIEGDLLIGTPIDLASSDAGLVPTGVVGDEKWPKQRVWVGSLLCGPDTIVLAAANHIPASKPDPPTIEPAKDVTITVDLPAFLQDVVVSEVTEDGFAPAACNVADGKAVLKVDAIESGRMFVLRRR